MYLLLCDIACSGLSDSGGETKVKGTRKVSYPISSRLFFVFSLSQFSSRPDYICHITCGSAVVAKPGSHLDDSEGCCGDNSIKGLYTQYEEDFDSVSRIFCDSCFWSDCPPSWIIMFNQRLFVSRAGFI